MVFARTLRCLKASVAWASHNSSWTTSKNEMKARRKQRQKVISANFHEKHMQDETWRQMKSDAHAARRRKDPDHIKAIEKKSLDKVRKSNKYKCTPCNYAFARGDNYRRHMKSKHNITIEPTHKKKTPKKLTDNV